eukprot:Gregarina_sp_Pseudo_9__926@NODE_1594_length_1470_cov_7_032844_g1478_i0_p3_GENE_NODE_1594_length_1470_cov_7_032844_g1478_i0NODE_1594_length_1470_cov_7_032844_g1478_i0_p3_ORF_typecomplete_len126_score21_60Prefoldin_2/PF01920_20/1_2e07CCDC154/PF15450_6/0_00037ZapB/PF06005_12/15ZapB/PF06005_12/0_0023MscS_porin/PF12795_7/0_00038MT/PF12777_7/88MT/PF12777_7/0_00081DMPK_coil/PF08826_10/1_2DMPK_coil/PF08826_10/0_072FlaC_arch/PF05377_11/0_21FlaC_arch/PF05377_11/3_2EzrA/PF06160_12/0_004FapA/PF03961_13/0_00
MGQAEDYTISAETQQALCEFAVLNWVTSELKSEVQTVKKEIEEIQDVLMEFNLEGSWLKVGESFTLIRKTDDALAELEEKQQAAEEKLAGYERRLADTEKESDRLKTRIESVMGDRVRLTAGDSA